MEARSPKFFDGVIAIVIFAICKLPQQSGCVNLNGATPDALSPWAADGRSQPPCQPDRSTANRPQWLLNFLSYDIMIGFVNRGNAPQNAMSAVWAVPADGGPAGSMRRAICVGIPNTSGKPDRIVVTRARMDTAMHAS